MAKRVKVGDAKWHRYGDAWCLAGRLYGDLLGGEGGADLLDEWFKFGWEADRSSALVGHDPIDGGIGNHATGAAEEARAASRHHMTETDEGGGARHGLVGAGWLVNE